MFCDIGIRTENPEFLQAYTNFRCNVKEFQQILSKYEKNILQNPKLSQWIEKYTQNPEEIESWEEDNELAIDLFEVEIKSCHFSTDPKKNHQIYYFFADNTVKAIEEYLKNQRFRNYEEEHGITTDPTYEQYLEQVFQSLAKFEEAYKDQNSLQETNRHYMTLYQFGKESLENLIILIQKYTDQPVTLEERGPKDPKRLIVKGECIYLKLTIGPETKYILFGPYGNNPFTVEQ